MFQTVVFDLDGTLLDTLQDLAAAGNHTLSAMGLPTHPQEEYRRMVGNGIDNLIRKMLADSSTGEASFALAKELFMPYYEAHMNDFTAPYPGMPMLLARLREKNIRVGILSNKADVFVQPIAEQYFPGLYDAAIGLREDFAPKPDPSSVWYLLQELGADKSATLYCGDSDVDVLTAQNAGLTSCGVLWGFRDKFELAAAGADYFAGNAEELEKIILDG